MIPLECPEEPRKMSSNLAGAFIKRTVFFIIFHYFLLTSAANVIKNYAQHKNTVSIMNAF